MASVHIGALITSLAKLKEWVVAEPAMFGENGVAITRRIEGGWFALSTYFGADLFSPSVWRSRGVDTDVPIRAAFYNVSRDERRWARAVENVLREELGVAPGGLIGPMLHQLSEHGGTLQEGTHARLKRIDPPQRAPSGVRVVFGVSDREQLQRTAKSFLEGAGFRIFPSALDDGREELTFWSEGRVVSTVALRFVDTHLVVDATMPWMTGDDPPTVTRDTLSEAHQQLIRAVDEVEAGHPAAPAPLAEPTIAASVDHELFADMLRVAIYQRVIRAVDGVSAARRDAELAQEITGDVKAIEAWGALASQLSGTVYGVDLVPTDGRVGAMTMTMFGVRELPTLDTSAQLPSLRPAEHSIGLSAQLGLIHREPWATWFTTALVDEALAVETSDASLFALPATLRLAPLLFSALAHDFQGHYDVYDEALAPLVAGLAGVEYLEIVSSTPDIRAIGRGELLSSVVFGPQAQDDIVKVQHLLEAWLASASDEVDDLTLATPGEAVTTTPYGTSEVHQRLTQHGDRPVLLSGVAVAPEVVQAEGSALQERAVHDVAFVHLEPVALLPLAREVAEDAIKPLDLDILVQRIGALQLHYGASKPAAGRALTLSATVGHPPAIPAP